MKYSNKTKRQLITDLLNLQEQVSLLKKKYPAHIGQDITDRKRVEEELRESKEKYLDLYDNAPDMFVSVDAQTAKILECNQTLADMLGYAKEEIISRSIFDLFAPDSAEQCKLKLFPQFTKTGIIKDEELQLLRKDGSTLDINMNVTAARDAQGNILYSRSTFRDITERKRAENNYQDLVEQSLMGLVIIQDFTIKFINDAFSKISGYSKQEGLSLTPNQVRSLVHVEDQKKVWGRLKDRLDGKETPSRYHYRGINKDGAVVWLDMYATLIDYEGKPAIQGAIVDISDQVISANMLRSSEEKYRDVFDHVSDFLYIHDLEGNFVETNLVWQEKLGYSEQELIGLNAAEIIPKRYHSEFADYLKKIKKDGHAEGLLTTKSKNGQTRIVEYKNSVILGSENPKLVRGSARDITDRLKIERKLKSSEIRFRSLIEQSPFSTVLYNPDGRPLFGNKAAAAMWNLEPKLIEHVYDTYNILEDEQLINLGIMPFIREGFAGKYVETPPIEYSPPKTEHNYIGSIKWLQAFIYPVHDENGVIREVVVMHEDITERTKAELALQESESKYRSLVNNIDLGIFRTSGDSSGNFIHANHALARMFGYPSVDDLKKTQVKDLYEEESDRKSFLDELRIRGSVKDKEIQLVKRDGSLIMARLNATPHFDDKGEVQWLDGIIEDVSEKKKLEDQLIHRVFHDELTELPNRALFMDRLERSIRRGKRDKSYLYAVMFIDLDRFKVVNDSLGHNIGDQVLWEIARSLEHCVREVDTVARFSGDEYIILLEDIRDITDAIAIANRIQESLSHPQIVGPHQMIVSGTIGIAIKPDGDISADEIIRDADIAMYRAKALGKNRYEIFDTNMLTATTNRLKLETDLRYGIENDQIFAQYQPIFNLDTSGLIGFEALVRWEHPENGLMFPGDFLEVAEETGMVINMGRIVIRKACNFIQLWSERYDHANDLTISVNLSGRQLLDPELITFLKEVFKETKLDPQRLKIEITEDTVMSDIDESILVLNQLGKMGVDSQIDDFGKGYSSLSMLHLLPIKTVKIDREFVRDIKKGGVNIGFARTIIMLANELGMNTIAEGIELKEQIKELIKVGCKLGQGYYYANPLDERDAGKFIGE